MPYIPTTEAERKELFRTIGVDDMDDLWRKARVDEDPPALEAVPPGRSEYEVFRLLKSLADRNVTDPVCFLGGGFYDHVIPAAISSIVDRGEFLTAYTPYQPEASQGTLQAIYEYQSAICRITGMEVANASLYDGGTALFEAILMALRKSPRARVVVAGSLSPIYRKMIDCYSSNISLSVDSTDPGAGLDEEARAIMTALDRRGDETAALVIQYPSFFGTIRDWSDVVAEARDRGIVTICSTYPIALSLLKTPGDMGFDIVTAEGQCLGSPLQFGGPYLGVLAARREFMRSIPGRIAGRTVDLAGTPGYVLTLQAREQHIRREKATSNICTNEALLALRAVIYLTLLGKYGFRRVGELCAAKARYARECLLAIPGVSPADDGAFFNEFTVRLPVDAGQTVGRMIDKGFAAGFPLGRYFPERSNELLVAVTEKRTREEIKTFSVALEAVLCN